MNDADMIIHKVCNELNVLAERKKFVFSIKNKIPIKIKINLDDLEKILINIIKNAISYNAPRGCVNVFVKKIKKCISGCRR